jgi:hypothetical protein
MATEQQKEKIRKEKAQLAFLENHLDDFIPSPRSAKALNDFLTKKGWAVDADNLEEAFRILKEQGFDFMTATVVVAPVAAASSKPDGSGEHLVEDLPDVPGVKNVPFTVSDINRMSPERYKKLYGTTHCPNLAFRARINEILRRARAEEQGAE